MGNKQAINYVAQVQNFCLYWEEINAFLPSKERLNSNTVALYLCLFHKWNNARFPEHLDIHREALMQMCGIGNHRTYTKILKKLAEIGVISYLPSQSKYHSSQVKMLHLTAESLQDLMRTVGIFAHGAAHSTAQGKVHCKGQGDAQGKVHDAAPLYKTIETNKQKKEEKEKNSPLPISQKFSLTEEEQNLLVQKVVQWCNYVRIEALGLSELLITPKEQSSHRKAALCLYTHFFDENSDFMGNLKFLNERFVLYGRFVKRKPNDIFLREVFTPQGIVAQNNFQQFEQGVENILREDKIPLPDKWDKEFYLELVKSGNKSCMKKYEKKLEEQQGLQVYFSKTAQIYAVKKVSPPQNEPL